MQYPYFYEENILAEDKTFVLSEETSRHCVQVLRMRSGSRLHLVNGRGLLVTASIAIADKKNTLINIESHTAHVAPPNKIHIAISLLKNIGRFEWFLEKAIEMGVQTITPLICERTEKIQFRKDRMKQIVISAMLQSRQTYLPVLNDPADYNHVVEKINEPQKFIAHCEKTAKKLLFDYSPVKDNAVILIGPEGDFTNTEIEKAFAPGFLPVSLGATRIRTETAGVYSAVLLCI